MKHDIVEEKTIEIDELLKCLEDLRNSRESEIKIRTNKDLRESEFAFLFGGFIFVAVFASVLGGDPKDYDSKYGIFAGIGLFIAIVVFFTRKSWFQSGNRKILLEKESKLEQKIKDQKIELAKLRNEIG